MTTLREAAQQALEALEAGPDVDPIFAGETEDALRAALAEPVQTPHLFPLQSDRMRIDPVTGNVGIGTPSAEPVAWRWGYRSVTTGEMDWRGYVEIAAHPNLRSPAIIMEPLYAYPPQRKPLTEEEIEKAYREIWRDLPSDFDHTSAGWIEMGIRYAERAHGIT